MNKKIVLGSFLFTPERGTRCQDILMKFKFAPRLRAPWQYQFFSRGARISFIASPGKHPASEKEKKADLGSAI
jgi:hypothetical protein